MTLTSPEGVAFAQRLGVKRAVLARELSLRELAKFKRDAHGGRCCRWKSSSTARSASPTPANA